MSDYTPRFLQETCEAILGLNPASIDRIIDVLTEIRANHGRVFFLGVGGGAGHASHAVNDFRKIAGIESYTPSDNVSELTAWINDDGWDNCYANWLRGSRLNARDAVFVFSVGGGSLNHKLSTNIVSSLKLAQHTGAKILGIVGRDGGYTAEVANACIIVPTISADTITPLVEAIQAVIWHLIVSHPSLRINEMKWEATAALV